MGLKTKVKCQAVFSCSMTIPVLSVMAPDGNDLIVLYAGCHVAAAVLHWGELLPSERVGRLQVQAQQGVVVHRPLVIVTTKHVHLPSKSWIALQHLLFLRIIGVSPKERSISTYLTNKK